VVNRPAPPPPQLVSDLMLTPTRATTAVSYVLKAKAVPAPRVVLAVLAAKARCRNSDLTLTLPPSAHSVPAPTVQPTRRSLKRNTARDACHT
jgi:hypothetical protein